MISSTVQLVLLLGIVILLIYGTIVAIVMIFSLPTLRYRRTKYQDDLTIFRWWMIPILLPLKICYSIIIWIVKIGKWSLFFVVGAIALLLSPIYFLIIRPIEKFIAAFQEAMHSFEKFVKLFKFGIRLGHWVMFYPEETINAEIPKPQFSPPKRDQAQLMPRALPINENGEETEND